MGDDTTGTTADAAAKDPQTAESAAKASGKPAASKPAAKKSSSTSTKKAPAVTHAPASKATDAEQRQNAVDQQDKRVADAASLAAADVDAAFEAAKKAAAPEPEKTEVTGYGTGDVRPTAVKPVLDKETQAENEAGIHVVVAGESLADIATRFGIGTDRLAKLNRLSTGYRAVFPGQKIRLRADVEV